MLYYENLNECEHSFFLGCKECEICKAVEHNKKIAEERAREEAREQAELEAWFESMEAHYQ